MTTIAFSQGTQTAGEDIEADSAEVQAEKVRAEAQEKAKLAKAENLKDLTSVATAKTNLGLGTAANEPTTAFDAKGAATAAQAAAEAKSDAKGLAAAEQARAEAAEALLAPLASPTLTGNPQAPTQAEGDNSTKLSTTQYADRAADEAREDAEAASIPVGSAIIIGGSLYPGTNAGFKAGLEAAKSTLQPVRVLAGEYTLTESLVLFNGLSMTGDPNGTTNLTSRVVIKNATASIFTYPEGASGTVKDIEITGIYFQGSGQNQNTWFIQESPTNASGWVPSDLRVTRCGFAFFRNVLKGSFLRLNFLENYVNNTSGAPLIVYGSDSYIEKNFIQSALIGNPASVPVYSEANTYVATQFVEYEARYFRAAKAVALSTPPPKAAESNSSWVYLPEAAPMYQVQYAMAQSTFKGNYLTPCPGLGLGLLSNYAGSQILDNKFNGYAPAVISSTGKPYGGCDGPGIFGQGVTVASGLPNPPGILQIRGNSFVNCGQKGWSTYTRSLSLYDTLDAVVEGNTFIYQTFTEAPTIENVAAIFLGKSSTAATNITIRNNVVQHGTGVLVAGGTNDMSKIKVDNPPTLTISAKETKELPIWCPPTFVNVASGGVPTVKLPAATNIEPGQVVSITNLGVEAATLTSNGGTVPVSSIPSKTALQVMSDGTNWQLVSRPASSKLTPLEAGRSAEMVAGKITITAPAVTATGAILISIEGTTGTVAPAVTARKAGENFTVEAVATSTDRVNWAVYE